MASEDALGGTPGRQNSVYNENLTIDLRVEEYWLSENKIILRFNHPIENQLNLSAQQIHLQNQVAQITAFSLQEDSLILSFDHNLEKDFLYEINLLAPSFCALHLADLTTPVFEASPLAWAELLISEVLFNPRAGGVRFVEIYNPTHRAINLQEVRLATVNSQGQLSGVRPLANEIQLIYPSEYRFITSDIGIVQAHYPSTAVENGIALPSLPSYANERGNVLLVSATTTLDSLYYTSTKHLSAIEEGYP